VKAIALEDGSENVVVVVRVPESLDAPHEVYLGKDPRIVLRRQDSPPPAALGEIEWLIARRDRVREGRHGEVDLDFFEQRLDGSRAGRYDYVNVPTRLPTPFRRS
jgi:hypothetical protein